MLFTCAVYSKSILPMKKHQKFFIDAIRQRCPGYQIFEGYGTIGK